MAQFILGAIRQAFYQLIEFDDESEARSHLRSLSHEELREAAQYLTKALSIVNKLLLNEEADH